MYPFRHVVSLVSAKLSLLLPRSINDQFACYASIIGIRGRAEDMKYETPRANLLETTYMVYTEFRTCLINDYRILHKRLRGVLDAERVSLTGVTCYSVVEEEKEDPRKTALHLIPL